MGRYKNYGTYSFRNTNICCPLSSPVWSGVLSSVEKSNMRASIHFLCWLYFVPCFTALRMISAKQSTLDYKTLAYKKQINATV